MDELTDGYLTSEQRQELAGDLYQEFFRKNDTIDQFEILSTIRYDPSLTHPPPTSPQEISAANFFLLPEHYNRLKCTSDFFLKQTNQTLDISQKQLVKQLKDAIKTSSISVSTPLKIRLLATLQGKFNIELYETAPRQNLLDGILEDQLEEQEIWDAFIDQEPTMISPFTSFKTTYRPHYSAARERCLPGKRPGKEEVLIFNPQSMLMEGSITNVAIKERTTGKWITPPLSSGCLCGVTRHFLLMKNYIQELPISRDMIKVGDEILLFNGIYGVARAKVVA